MLGSFLINCWMALFSFTIYFIYAIQKPLAMPIPTLATAFIIALVAFLFAYPFRSFLGYVFYTPAEIVFKEQDDNDSNEVVQENIPFTNQKATSTLEFADESTEDIAQVVRTMMHREDQMANN